MEGNNLINKGVVVAVILLFISVSVIPSTGTIVEKKSTMPTFYDGNTLYVGGNGSGNYTKIQDAINDSSNGDTVFVYDDSSPYYENVVVDKSINLVGEDKNTTVIDGGRSGEVVNISAGEVVISDFTIQNSGVKYDIGIIIRYPHTNISITNNIITYNEKGIYVLDSCNVLVEGNHISFNKFGIMIIRSTITVSENIFSNNYFIGIYIEGDGNLIINNTITGVLSEDSYDCQIKMYGKNNIIAGNSIVNSDTAIGLRSGHLNKIIGNNICYNRVFILFEHSNGNLISQNNFIDNEYTGKDFTFFNSRYNKWERNYWNRTRILPYFIFGKFIIEFSPIWVIEIRWFNIDWFPAKKPYDI